MSERQEQARLLTALEKHAQQALGLAEIRERFAPDVNPRTLRRWLTNWITLGLIEKLGDKKNAQYRYIQPHTSQVQNVALTFSAESQRAIAAIKAPLYQRPPVSYQTNWLVDYIPNQTYYLPESIRKKLHTAGKREQNHDPAGTYARHIYNRLLIDLSYNSSRLEGNTYSLLETEQLILEGTDATQKLDEEKIMILNHKEAIRYLVNHTSEAKLTSTTLFTLHYLLSDGLISSGYAGNVRDHGVRISHSSYIPLENPHAIQTQLDILLKKARNINCPFEQSFFLLMHIAYLQAFADVNKRTARLCANIPLVKHNFVPLSFNELSKEDYLAAMLAIYELNKPEPLIELYVYSYLRTCRVYDARAYAVGFDEIRIKYRQQRRKIIAEIILKQLHDETLTQFIDNATRTNLPSNEVNDFKRTVMEDLKLLNPVRIAGLGISLAQLNAWLAKRR